MLKNVPPAVVRAPASVMAAVSTVGRAMVVSRAALPFTLIVQLLPVTAPVKVIVPSEARLDIGRIRAVATPAARAALLNQLFILSSKSWTQPMLSVLEVLSAASRSAE